MQSSGDLGQAIAFGDLLTALRRNWTIVVALTVLGALGGGAAATLLPPNFEATTQMLVLPTGVDRSDPATRVGLVEPQLEIQLVRSTDVLAEAARAVSPEGSPEALRRNLVVTNVDDTDLLVLSITATSENRALQLVEAITTAYLDQRRQRAQDDLQTRTDSVELRLQNAETDLETVNEELAEIAASETPQAGRRVLLEGRRDVLTNQVIALQQEQAQLLLINTEPGRVTERPRITNDGGLGPVITIIGGTAFGLFLGLGLALLRDRTDTRLWTAHDVERVVPDIPVVTIGLDELSATSFLDGAGYREVRDLVISFPVPSATTLVLLSPRTDSSVAYVASGVAGALSRAGLRTVLLDPLGFEGVARAATWMGHESAIPPRLDDYLFGDTPLTRAVVTVPQRPNLEVLRRSPDAVDRDVTVSPRLRALLWRQDRRRAVPEGEDERSVVVAGPGVIDSPDGAVLGGMGDTVAVVCRARVTTREDLTRTLRNLRTHAATVVSIVLVPTDAP